MPRPYAAEPRRQPFVARTRRRGSPPRLRTSADPDTERHATWLELFFDLVFVVAVAELGHSLAHDTSATGFLQYGALFIPVWWAWVGFTYYADRFDTDDLTYRVLVLAAMLAIASVAVAVPRTFHDDAGARTFAASYLAVRLILIVLYLRAHRHVPDARPLTGRYSIGFALGALCWLVSIAVPEPARYWLWAAGMIIELATPLLSTAAIARVPFSTSHIPERFGLFTIIVLGESVLVGTTAIAGQDLGGVSTVSAVLAFTLAAAIWWIYFEYVDSTAVRRWQLAGQTWMYGHLVIYAGITASAEGALFCVHSAEHGSLTAGSRWALYGGLGAFFVATAAIAAVGSAIRRRGRVVIRAGAAAACAALAAAGGGLSPAWVLASAVLVLALAILAEEPLTPDQGQIQG